MTHSARAAIAASVISPRDSVPFWTKCSRTCVAQITGTDVVGYSRLMERDERGTLARLKAYRKEHFEPALARHGGRLVKLTGDGALAEFGSAVDALNAAIEFQKAMTDAAKHEPEDRRIVFRIGLHVGDLLVDGDDLNGDAILLEQDDEWAVQHPIVSLPIAAD